MCGIAGILSRRPIQQDLRQAMNYMKHRGPESDGLWVNEDGTVMLGHRRLSIIDQRNDAAQPMLYADRYVITYNGEIYNYIELKKILGQKGYAFNTYTDTEVILAAYDAFGTECLQRFDGMFAFAIWDKKENRLFVARDRFGEKPLYYYYADDCFLFSSEMKVLWQLNVEKTVNKKMVYNFIAIGYTVNPGDPQETFFQHIHKLPAASYIIYDLNNHQLSVEKYWQIYPEVNSNISEADANEQVIKLFTESIQKRLRSSVSIGTSLSGGLDSSAIVAMCAKEDKNNYSHKCFTADFKGYDKSERVYAEKVANQFNLKQYFADVDGNDIVQLMDEVMYYQEEPVTSASVLAQYKVYKLAKQCSVTVLLDGQGADEVFAGYHKYYKWYWQELFAKKKLRSSRELISAKDIGINEPFTFMNKAAALFPEFAAGMRQSRRMKQAYQHPDLSREFSFDNKHHFYYSLPASPDLNGALFFNTFVVGLEELLRYADRNSMAHSTEVRLPYLSHELVSFLFKLPSGMKINKGWTKWILRKAMEEKLPADIVWRKEKTGFEPPQKAWMENREVKEAIMNGKKKLVDQGILNAQVLNKKVKPHSAYAANTDDWKYWSLSYLF